MSKISRAVRDCRFDAAAWSYMGVHDDGSTPTPTAPANHLRLRAWHGFCVGRDMSAVPGNPPTEEMANGHACIAAE